LFSIGKPFGLTIFNLLYEQRGTLKKKEQKEYLDKELQPRLEEAKRGKRTVYFADAAHFVHGAFIACVWCIVRVFINHLLFPISYSLNTTCQ